MAKFTGTALIQLPDEREWDPRLGQTTVRTWRGAPPLIEAMESQLKAAGRWHALRRDPESGYMRLSIRIGGEESETAELADQWELLGNDLEKDIWQHRNVAEIMKDFVNDDGSPSDQYFEIKDEIIKLAEREVKPADVAWWEGASLRTKLFVRVLTRGVTAFPESQFVLRNTKVVGSGYSLKPTYERVNKILTTEQVKQHYSPPDILKFALPEGFWLERTPKVTQAAADRWQIIREWWHAEEYEPFIHERAES